MVFVLIVVILILFALTGTGLWYLYRCMRHFQWIQRAGVKGKILAWTLPLGITALIVVILGMSFVNIFIILAHLIAIWALCNGAQWIALKVRKRPFKYDYAGLAAIGLTVTVLVWGWVLAHHVVETNYHFTTQKDLPELRIAQIADAHLGVTLDGNDFAAELARIQAAKPDLLVITGDFVDDDTAKADMLAACDALGDFHCTYGIYFVYGNHDKGYFTKKSFSADELARALERNGVTILEDEAVLVADTFYVIGRQDRSVAGRKSMAQLVAPLDRTKYMIVLDHQPNDYDAEAAAGVDLVLSGHTHGGHLFPLGYVGLLMGSNDFVYGTQTREDTHFVVTSGISGWAIPFKTGTGSEYVLITVTETP